MFVEYLYRSLVGERSGVRLLDMCAAPGGKTTLYASLVGSTGIVVANETIRSRVQVLADNVRRWGTGNTVVTNNDPTHFAALEGWFDVVAVDAPCSGEGMFRKSEDARSEWSQDLVKLCAARQRRILHEAWGALKPGGILIYSTCTFNRIENEENVAWLAGRSDCQGAGLSLPPEWGIVETQAGGISCFRFLPHKIKGEGFFVSVFRKADTGGRVVRPKSRKQPFTDLPRQMAVEAAGWVENPERMCFARVGDQVYGYYEQGYDSMKTVSENLTALYSGVCMGRFYGNDLKPDPALALFHGVQTRRCGFVELSLEEVLRYLHRENLSEECVVSLNEGMNLVAFGGHPLGWIKRVGHRANTLYPMRSKIVNL